MQAPAVHLAPPSHMMDEPVGYRRRRLPLRRLRGPRRGPVEQAMLKVGPAPADVLMPAERQDGVMAGAASQSHQHEARGVPIDAVAPASDALPPVSPGAGIARLLQFEAEASPEQARRL